MLSFYVKRSPGEEFEKVQTPFDENVWVTGEHVDEHDTGLLVKQYGLNKNIVDDVRDTNELTRVEFNEGREYVFLRVPQLTKRGKALTTPLLVVIGKKHFFTLASRDNLLPTNIIAGSVPAHSEQGAGLLLGTVASLLAAYEELIQHTSRTIKDTGQRLQTHEVTNRDFVHFVTVEDNLNEYQMNLDGTLAVMGRLRENTHALFSEEDVEAIEDLMLHIKQLLVGISTYAKSVESIRNAYSTIANNNLNTRMKTLTVLTVLIALPNVFFGMFGMNVVLPFSDQPWAYAAIVGFSVAIIIFVYFIARRLKIF